MRTSEHPSGGTDIRRGAARMRLLAGTLVAGLLMSLIAGTGAVRAQAQLSYTLITSTAVDPGAQMTIAVSPANVNIVTSSPVPGCALTGVPGPTATYTCPAAPGSSVPAILAGAAIYQTFNVTAGPISETVSYNVNSGNVNSGGPVMPPVSMSTKTLPANCPPPGASGPPGTTHAP